MLLLTASDPKLFVWLRRILLLIFFAWLVMVMTKFYFTPRMQKPEVIQPPAKNVAIQQIALPKVPERTEPTQATKQQSNSEINKSQASAKARPDYKKNRSKPAKSGNKQQQVEQLYHQLNAKGVDIQLAWPQDNNQRQAAWDFMYLCAGVQFAVLNNNQITQVNQQSQNDYSEWIRVAQGDLSTKEQNWIKAYGLKGTPIRLFPKQIDWRLANNLANALKGAALVSLRASYQVFSHQLLLTNIQLNNHPITESWLLYQDSC